ncbi:MAG: metalloregulator ArsR/SmtB family transcription factor [Dehalococcoidia bacterium]|nr:metalloregulator ArsR/SmtB family transcription factor [Dehalococcoidia bacterium]
MRDLLKAFKALSDDTRLRILNVLLERECCVCEVMQALSISQSRTSRNLGILNDAGFLKSHRDGMWTVYAIDYDAIRQYRPKLVELVGLALEGNSEAQKDRERLRKAERVGPGCAAVCTR